MLNDRTNYLQLAFNDDLATATRLIPTLPKDPRLILEAGTPFIKREGMRGVQTLHSLWPYNVLADLKTADGAFGEVAMAAGAGASMATVLGSCPAETLNLFIATCAQYGMDSFVDLIGLADPLGVLRKLRRPPAGIVLHLGRVENPRPFPRAGKRRLPISVDATWDPPDLLCASRITGTLNDNSDRDAGWTLEVQIPLNGPPGGRTPQIGEVWRLNLYRIHGCGDPDREFQSWSVVGVDDFHVPQRFGYLRFVGPITAAH